jgi:predicted transcriptional regulator
MKTVTMRVDDSTWRMISAAADGQKRTISSFLEFAVLQYLSSAQYVDNAEMDDILQDKELVRNLKEGLEEVENGEYTLV